MPFARGQAFTLAFKYEETSLRIPVNKTQEHVFDYCLLHLNRSTFNSASAIQRAKTKHVVGEKRLKRLPGIRRGDRLVKGRSVYTEPVRLKQVSGVELLG